MDALEAQQLTLDASVCLTRRWGITTEAALSAMRVTSVALGLPMHDLAALVSAKFRLHGVLDGSWQTPTTRRDTTSCSGHHLVAVSDR